MNKFHQESYASENALCMAFVRNIENRRNYGLCRPFLYFHIVNEQPRQKNGSNVAAAIIGKRLKDMGRKAGVLDYAFMWQGVFGLEVGFLEAKHGKNGLQPSQSDFIEDCNALGIRTGVFRTVQEGMRHLQDWGVIKPDVWT